MAAIRPTSRLSTNYDVFISFRTEDTRNNFAAFLYRDLKRAGIDVFIGDEDQQSGEEVGPELLAIIQQSKISIIVFSKHYADSRWCLQELVEIARCNKSNGQIILPIYFDVEQCDVRNQSGSFGISFQRHMEIFDEMTIKLCKDVLRVVGGVRRFDLRKENWNKPRLVELVVDSASTLLNSNTRLNYDVFVSFRGIDTRNNFTAFLHRELKRVGINVFMDNECLWIGDEIQPVLLEAIRRSQISIIVFSEHYADSKWCLLELAEVVRCHRFNGQKILPVYLNVNPTDVRDLTGNIENAFHRHLDRIDPQTIESWKDAVNVVGGKEGVELGQLNGCRNQSELVDKVVNLILRELYLNNWLD